MPAYLRATRHPWSAVLFILPLLAIYEAGLLLLDPVRSDTVRNGAHNWLRTSFEHFGLAGLLWAPIVLLAILLIWSYRRREDRPDDWLAVWVGMVFESVFFAFALWGVSQSFGPFIEDLGLAMARRAEPKIDPALEQVISYLGAGIYEEAIFRLLLFSILVWFFELVELPAFWGVPLAAVISAAAFALAHNLGAQGEPFHNLVFLFRTMAGLYFAALFQWRGFGIAVGAHTGYDVLIGIMVYRG